MIRSNGNLRRPDAVQAVPVEAPARLTVRKSVIPVVQAARCSWA